MINETRPLLFALLAICGLGGAIWLFFGNEERAAKSTKRNVVIDGQPYVCEPRPPEHVFVVVP